MIRGLFAAIVAASVLAGGAASAAIPPRDPIGTHGLNVAPPVPQLDRHAAGLACGRFTHNAARCSLDWHDAGHSVQRFCVDVFLMEDVYAFTSCFEPGPRYVHSHAIETTREYRVPSHGPARAGMGCYTEVGLDRLREADCQLSLNSWREKLTLAVFLNGRWVYAATYWPNGRVTRTAA